MLAVRRRSNVSKVMPIRGASEQPSYRLAHAKPAYAVRPRTSSLLRGFGCRCGACDVGYYGLLGRCHECGNRILVLFLSHAVPFLTILAITAIFFWGGNVDLPKANHCRYIRSVGGSSHRSVRVLQLMWQADFLS